MLIQFLHVQLYNFLIVILVNCINLFGCIFSVGRYLNTAADEG